MATRAMHRSMQVQSHRGGGRPNWRKVTAYSGAALAVSVLVYSNSHRVIAHTRAALPHDFAVLPVGGDGNCLFRALAQANHYNKYEKVLDYNGESAAAQKLRAAVIAEMVAQKETLQWFVDQPWDAYIQKMATSGTWGGEPELSVAPVVLQVPVHVYIRPNNFLGLPKKEYTLMTQYGDNLPKKGGIVRVLFYGQHYDALLLPPAHSGLDSDASSEGSL